MAFFASTIFSVVALRWMPVWFTPLMFIRVAQQAGAGQPMTLHHHWVPLEEISPSLSTAVMASEDAHFLEHNGFDYKAIEHAAMRNMKHPEKRKLGASTISQQTAKNVFLWPGRSWVRKGFEVYFTVLIELVWSKERCRCGGRVAFRYDGRQTDQGSMCIDCCHVAQSAPFQQCPPFSLYVETPEPHPSRNEIRKTPEQ